MLKLDLARLLREGSLEVDAEIPPSDPLWSGTALTFEEPVAVRGTASVTVGDQVVVRVEVDGTLARECRRCLDPVRTPVEESYTMVWAPRDELAPGQEDEGEIRPLDRRSDGVDLGEALREELVLSVDRWVECREACKGLCPLCGVNRNRETCDCSLDEPDPRWDALRALKNE